MKKLAVLLTIILSFGFQFINAQKIEVSYSSSVLNEKFSGNVFLYLSKDNLHPKDVFVGAEILPVFRIQVNNIKPNQKVVFDDTAISFPVELSNLERGIYNVQAVFDRNLGGRSIGNSTGNLYSNTIKVNFSKDHDKVFTIACNQIVKDFSFVETKHYKEIKVTSKLLSDFHKKEISINAAISLPKEYYDNPKTNFPVIYTIFGFGGDYKAPLRGKGITHLGDTPVITIYLDGSCSEGHSVYANSDINGPWGDAFVKEFIPTLNKTYRTNGANLLTGHSSGGWATLWLQINYPNTFIGTWSSAPDQVDFRNYQNKNIYKDTNFYFDKQGNALADITIAGLFPMIKTKDIYQMENVIYRGEQFHSFDAVFGSIDSKGKRVRLVEPKTGSINKNAIPYWKRFDISLLLRNNWDEYKDALSNKIRISVGDQDNFYLHKAVHLLDEEMKKLNANIEFDYFSGDHFTVHFNQEYQRKGQQFLEQCYKRWTSKKH